MGIDQNEKKNRAWKAPKKGSTDTNTGNPLEFQFVDTYLDQEDEHWLENNRDVADDFVLSLVSGLEPGFKLSVSFDSKSGLYLSTLTDNVPDSPNRGKIRTARASAALDSLYALYYKLRHKSPNGLWENGGAARKWG